MKEPLYIHLHIPKTAGYTFRYHVQKNLKEDEHLLLTYDLLGISSAKPPKDPNVYRKATFKYLSSMPKEKLKNIKLVHGHVVPYGVHKFFGKEPKYFTFVRNPIDRTISFYNYLCSVYKREMGDGDTRKYSYYEDNLLINKKIPGFKMWLNEKYKYDYKAELLSMVGYLKIMSYLGGGVTNKMNIVQALKKFDFVGVTRQFDEESLYFFQKLGMHKFFWDQNISKKKNSGKIENGVLAEISKRNKYDQFLYEIAQKWNSDYKKSHPDFYELVKNKQRERSLLRPFTQPLFAPRQTLLRLIKWATYKESIVADPTHFSGMRKK